MHFRCQLTTPMAAVGAAGAAAERGTPQRRRRWASRAAVDVLCAWALVVGSRFLAARPLLLAAVATLLAVFAGAARFAAALLRCASASLRASPSRGVELRVDGLRLRPAALDALSAALPPPLQAREAAAERACVTWRGGPLRLSLEGARVELEVRSQPMPQHQRAARAAADAAAAAALRRAKLAALRRRLR